MNIGIRPSVNSVKNETGCKAGDTCLFPHHKIDEQPNKKPKKCYFTQKRESEDKGAVAFVKSVSQLACVSQDSDALDSQGTKDFRGDPMQKVLNAFQRVRFTKSTTSREYPGQRKVQRLENTSQTSTSAKSLRYNIRGSVPRRD